MAIVSSAAASVLACNTTIHQLHAAPDGHRDHPAPVSAAAAPSHTADGWGPVRNGLQTRLAAETDAHAVGRPVQLRAEMRNVGQAARTYIDRPFQAQDPLRVQGPDGRPAAYIAGPCQVMVEPKSIAPGETVVLFEGYDAAGTTWMLRSSGADQPFEVPANETLALPIGPPLVAKVDVQQRERTVSVRLALVGQGGEQYAPGAMKGKERMPPPKLQIVDEAGKVLQAGEFEYG